MLHMSLLQTRCTEVYQGLYRVYLSAPESTGVHQGLREKMYQIVPDRIML